VKKEKWKRLKQERGFIVSSWGRIVNLQTGKLVSPFIHKSRSNKYLRVNIKDKKYMLHVLVGTNFKGKEYRELNHSIPYKEIEWNHEDRNTLNCNASNISPISKSKNIRHSYYTNQIQFNGREYKLSGGQVEESTN